MPGAAASIILVNPQLDRNVGSVARVMMNFGLDDLRVVSPKASLLSPDALATSKRAHGILFGSSVFDSLEGAIADLSYVYCTSCRTRDLNKEVIRPCDLVLVGGKTGFVFGPEDKGLCNSDLSYANKVIEIDTSERFQSMNLAQSVCVICYELSKKKNNGPSLSIRPKDEIFKKHQMMVLLDFLESELEKIKFFQEKNKKRTMMDNIRSMFFNMEISDQELQTLMGLLRYLSGNRSKK